MSFLPVLKFREMQMENPYIRFPNAPHIPKVEQNPSKKIKLKSPQNAQFLSNEMNLITGQQPFFVNERQEINTQAFILQKKKRRKRLPDGKRIDNQLEADFPIHNKFNFVEAHSFGFKGRQNIDLFQFYYRLYKKNKFFIQKLRKQKKERLQQKEQLEQKLNEELKDKKKEIRQSIVQNKSNPISKKEKPKGIKIQELVIQKGLDELRGIEVLLNEQPQQQQKNTHKKTNNSYSTLPMISKQLKVNVCNLEASMSNLRNLFASIIFLEASKSVHELQYLEMQQIFINRVTESIKSRGLESVPAEDVKQLKEIITKRKEQLSEMQSTLDLQFLLKVKNKMYQNELITKQQEQLNHILEQERKMQDKETQKVSAFDLSSIQQHSISGYQHGYQKQNMSIFEFKFLEYEDQSINNSVFLKKPSSVARLENLNQDLSQINQENSQLMQRNQNSDFLNPSAKDKSMYHDTSLYASETNQNIKQEDHVQEEVNPETNSPSEQQDQNVETGKKLKKVKKKKIIKVKKQKVQQNDTEVTVDLAAPQQEPKQKKKKKTIKNEDDGTQIEQEEEEQGEVEIQIEKEEILLEEKESEYEEIEVEDEDYEYYYEGEEQDQEVEEDKKQEGTYSIENDHQNEENEPLNVFDQQASDIIEQLLSQQESTNLQEESLISLMIEDSNNATTLLREKLEKANIPPHIIEKKLKIVVDQSKILKQQEKQVSQQELKIFLKKQLAPAKFKQILVENEAEVDEQRNTSKNKSKLIEDDKAEFYNQHRENLQEGKIIKEIRDLQMQQEIEINRQRARLIRKQTSNVNKTLSSNEDSFLQDERAKGKFKKNEFGQKISDKDMLKQYRQKEAIIDQEKFLENLKKMNEMSQDQKKMMLEAFQVKLQKQENQEELDEELNFLQSIVEEHKNQRTQILQQFQDELIQKRTQKQQQQQSQINQKQKNKSSQNSIQESRSEQQQLSSHVPIEELLSERNNKIKQGIRGENNDEEDDEENLVQKIQKKQPKQKQYPKQPVTKSIKSLRNLDEQKSRQIKQIKSTTKISFERSDEPWNNENQQSETNLPKQHGLVIEQDQENDNKSLQSQQSHKTKQSQISQYQEKQDDKNKERDASKFKTAKKLENKKEEEQEEEEEEEEEEVEEQEDSEEEIFLQKRQGKGSQEQEDIEDESEAEEYELEKSKKQKKKQTISDTPSRASQKTITVPVSKTHPKKKKKKKKKNQKAFPESGEEDEIEGEPELKPNYSLENQKKKAQKSQNLNDLINEKINDQNHQVQQKKNKNKVKSDSEEEENDQVQKKKEAPRVTNKRLEAKDQQQQKKKRRETTEVQSDEQSNEEEEEKLNQKRSLQKKVKGQQQKKKVNKKDELAEQQLLQQQILEQELLRKEAEKKKFNLKDELESMKKRNLSLRELKKEIEAKIQNIDPKELTDETKYNIFLYMERQKQMKNFSGHLDEIVQDALERMPECSDVIKVFFEARSKYKDVAEKDKELKFSNQIKIEDVEVKEAPQIDLTSVLDDIQYKIQRMLQMAQQGILRETSQERKELFQFDSELLMKLKEMYRAQTMVQTSIEKSGPTDSNDQIKENFQSSLVSEEKSVQKEQSQLEDSKLKLLTNKLKKIKKSNQSKFNDIVQRSRQIQFTDYLSTTPYKDLTK